MINPFVICSVEEQALYRAYADREAWELRCQACGATLEQVRALDMDVWRYAQTTPYPNSDVIAYVRRLALEMLMRGEAFPTSAQAVLDDDQRRYLEKLAALLDGR